MPTPQQQINYGNTANDGQGDPLRTAFIKTDDNFDAIWNTGPVGSNVTILNNIMSVVNTNGNLAIAANGVGVIQTNSSLVPQFANSYDLGSATLRYRSLFVGTGGAMISGNVAVSAISTDNYFYANGAPFSPGSVYSNADVAGFLASFGSNSIVTTGNITANSFIGDGSQLTGLPAGYANANVLALGEAGWAGNIIPSANAVYSLGNATMYWSNLWVAGNTIYIGGVPLGITAGNVLTVAGEAVLSNDSDTSISTTGNITGGNISTTGGLSTTGAMSAGAFVITGIATPAALTTNTNNWAPAGMSTAMVLRISSTQSINLTGIAAPSPAVNQLWYVYNVGTPQIAFVNESALSSAGNRFLFGNNRTLQAHEGIILWYDVASGGWRSPGVQV